jgi:hypothetical protein
VTLILQVLLLLHDVVVLGVYSRRWVHWSHLKITERILRFEVQFFVSVKGQENTVLSKGDLQVV